MDFSPGDAVESKFRRMSNRPNAAVPNIVNTYIHGYYSPAAISRAILSDPYRFAKLCQFAHRNIVLFERCSAVILAGQAPCVFHRNIVLMKSAENTDGFSRVAKVYFAVALRKLGIMPRRRPLSVDMPRSIGNRRRLRLTTPN